MGWEEQLLFALNLRQVIASSRGKELVQVTEEAAK